MRRRHRPPLTLLLLLSVAVLSAPACSSGDDGDAKFGARSATTTKGQVDSSSSTADAATTSTAAPVHVLPPGTTSTGRPRTATPTTRAPSGPPPAVKLTRIATLQQPVAFAPAPSGPDLYVAEKTGRVRALRGGTTVDPEPVLDLSGEVSDGGEQGLLGIAFSPAAPHHLYVNFTDSDGNTVVAEFAMQGGRAVASSRRELLMIQQPYSNHNGGHLAFDGDARLWIGMGDGGAAGDPQNRAQRLDTLLGKMLRIDPKPSGGKPYTVPPDNPFVGRAGAMPEIWALGLRNPWRYTFDRANGDLWIADVGQGEREEVNYTAAGSRGGQNYGWARMEGTRRYSGDPPAGAIAPVHELTHGDGNCSVTGGYIYRGGRIARLGGFYLFGDYCRGELLALGREGSTYRAHPLGHRVESLTSFGQDSNGELYVLSQAGGVFRIDPA